MDIAEDVLKAAEAAQDAAMARCKAANFAVYEYPFNTGRAKDVLDQEIAKAIQAERERAAKVAEGWRIVGLIGTRVQDDIASAIRSGER